MSCHLTCVKYEDLLQVPQEPTTCLNKEDVKPLNDWRNEFGRGLRHKSVRNSFTKGKADTLPFYMYTSVNLDTKADETSHDLAEATVQELFISVLHGLHGKPIHQHRQPITSYLQQATVILVT